MTSSALAALLRKADGAQERSFHRILSPHGTCESFRLRWVIAGQSQTADIAVPQPQPIFMRWETDADGHAYQLLDIEGETHSLYPVLDPFSLEHAVSIEQTILPAILDLYEADPQRDAFAAFRDFSARLEQLTNKPDEILASLNPAESRVFEILKGDINEMTPPEDMRRHMFVRFYQYVTCDTTEYRQKAHRSLEQLVQRVNDLYISGLDTLLSTLREHGFNEDAPQYHPG